MKRILILATLVVLIHSLSFAQGDRAKVSSRIEEAGNVLNEIMAAPDSGIPEEIFSSAKCVAVVPSFLKGGLGFGAAYGKGVASCRTEKGWSSPAFFSLKGGSFGLQIGGEAVDLVMLIMNDAGMKNLLSSKFKLGADGSVAAGPVGRHAEGSTDWKMKAQVLTYSRARGVFAGITINGSVISQGKDDTRSFYGRMVPFKTILNGNIEAPADSAPFLQALTKYSGVPAPAAPQTPNSGN
ncbi:MAG TPA: lipid-binding SYLF domain-containing protein [Terriglobales bacterium]|nr:lipid-binding SYLF domain-containing protein [Terriglobales bacterium]